MERSYFFSAGSVSAELILCSAVVVWSKAIGINLLSANFKTKLKKVGIYRPLSSRSNKPAFLVLILL
jgi:hypothetical protein